MMQLSFNKIHKFKFEDIGILLDINSGSVHVIDEVTWQVLDALEDSCGEKSKAKEVLAELYSEEVINEVINELEVLIAENSLFTSDMELLNYQPPQSPVVKALCLHIAH